MFTAGIIEKMRPEPPTALLYGTGLGASGAVLIRIAKKYVDRVLGQNTGD